MPNNNVIAVAPTKEQLVQKPLVMAYEKEEEDEDENGNF